MRKTGIKIITLLSIILLMVFSVGILAFAEGAEKVFDESTKINLLSNDDPDTDLIEDDVNKENVSEAEIQEEASEEQSSPLMDIYEELPPIDYLDENGVTQTCTEYELLTSHEEDFEFEDGKWYVVKSTVKLGKTALDGSSLVKGDVHIILADKCRLNAINGIGLDDDSCLTIYAQSTGSSKGRIHAGNAYIGGNGTLIINGGLIKSITGYQSSLRQPGIKVKTLVINGGEVAAWGADGTNHGIEAESITINGGSVTSSATWSGDGIHSTNVEINGGTVVANAAREGIGIWAETILINNGTVTANGINGIEGEVKISGGTINANADSKAIDGLVYLEKGMILKDNNTGNLISKGDALWSEVINKLGKNISISVFPESGTTGDIDPPSSDVPKTGDENSSLLVLFIMTAFLSIGELCFVIRRIKQ